jgi:hypothetical protein
MSEYACECSFQVEVGVAAWTRGLSKPLFGPCRKAKWVVEVSSMQWDLGAIWELAGLWGIMQLAQAEKRAGGEPVISVAQRRSPRQGA